MAHFQDVRRLGSGGFGEVWACTSEGVRYAKKKLTATDEDSVARFQREVRILSKLDHPNIVKVVAKKLQTSPYWYVMPLYRRSLEAELPALVGDEQRVRKIFTAILDGVEYAHGEGVIHRDLKPGNVLMNSDDDVVVSDFGLGRMLDAESTRRTQSGEPMGTRLYMAPEQWSSAKEADERSDIYTLGRILYALHTGPLDSTHHDLANVPPNVRVVISKCTQQQPDKRFQSVTELKEAWLIAVGELFASSTAEEVRKLAKVLSESVSGGEDIAEELLSLLLQHEDDADLIHETVMLLPARIVARMEEADLDATKRLVQKFVEHTTAQGWGFSYTDKIGQQCKRLYQKLGDYEIRADLVYCILDVGEGHNRYFVQGILDELLEAPKKPGEGLAIYERLKHVGRSTLDAVKARLSPAKVDAAVKRLFEARRREKR
jgi:tRNA A-37 threonylcarbamoyl transferase component Bud32